MDIFELINRSYKVLKSNLLLFLPPLVLTYLAPVALVIAALYIFIPVLVIAGNLPNPIIPLIGGGFAAAVVILVLALVLFVAIVAGMSNLNKTALINGQTSFNDFKIGVKKYFARILGGIILFAIIYVVIFSIGLGAIAAMVFSAMKGFLSPELFQEGFSSCPFLQGGDISDISECPFIQDFSDIPNGSMLILTIFKIFANFSGVALIIITLSALIFIFTLFWIPAAVVDDLGVFKAIRRSVGFVKENFYTTIGYFGLLIIAQLFTSQIFPGGGGGGGGQGFFYIVIPPALGAIFQLVIMTFFVLLLFAIYIDRKSEPSNP